MNIFRELVDELKDENLLEQTVIEPVREESGSNKADEGSGQDAVGDGERQTAPSSENEGSDSQASESQDLETPGRPVQEPEDSAVETDAGSEGDPDNPDSHLLKPKVEFGKQPLDSGMAAEHSRVSDETPDNSLSVETISQDESKSESTAAESSGEALANPSKAEQMPALEQDEPLKEEQIQTLEPDNAPRVAKIRTLEEEKKFYRQRAMDEVIGLQLVEHVLSGVEREQMKTVPKTFDDLAVKRALHDFLKVADDLNSPEHSKAEFQLMQETENWCSSLSRRDRNISVAHVRRYCETTKPSLSSQALISLARFYRNSPYSESVRSKFDLVFTRLFSKDQGSEMRSVVFKNGELIKHVQELYADWSSIPLYATEEDDSELLLTALKFQDFINEANSAESFDELVRKDFFKRLKVFKQRTNENFFAPLVVAAAIESNVTVGNRYVELIEIERQRSAGTEIGDKYGVVHDSSISEATSKTLDLLEILRAKKPEMAKKSQAPEVRPAPKPPETAVRPESKKPSKRFTLAGGANKWLIVATVVVIVVTAWLLLQGTANVLDGRPKGSIAAREFTLSGTVLSDFVHSARVSRNTMYGITRDSWERLPTEEKKALVEKAVKMGEGNDFEKVHLLNSEGKSRAFGSESKVAVY